MKINCTSDTYHREKEMLKVLKSYVEKMPK